MATGTQINVGSNGSSLVAAFFPFLLAAILIFGVFFLVYWLLKSNSSVKTKGDFFKVLASQPLDRFSNIHLIKYMNAYYIIVTTGGSSNLIEKIEDPGSIEQIDLKYSSRKSSAFSNILNRKLFEQQIKKLDSM